MSADAIYNVILGAHISEKATVVAEQSNQFVFKVRKEATRPQIKAAVEKIYGVSVAGVTVANVKGKVKKTMRGLSKKPSWKKAYVRVVEGQEIDFTAEAK
ncbi:50S ribosomal protein L23 [Pseudomonadales bacterium]|jgi:large subunit ribosomal protein L23|nr:50S ribosomal protein L23 [Pseudomonadales bacterium]